MDAKEVFLVEHVHVLEDGEEDVKIIGVYSTRDAAQQAVERLRLQPGFCDTPEGFTIDLYWLDQDSWEQGFATVRPQADGKDSEGISGTVRS
jgi:hypothetical protein